MYYEIYNANVQLRDRMHALSFPLYQSSYSNRIKAINSKGETLFDCYIYTTNPPQVAYRASGERWTTST